MGAACALKVGPAGLRLPLPRAQGTQRRSSAIISCTCSILSHHGHLAASLPSSSFGLFHTTGTEVRCGERVVDGGRCSVPPRSWKSGPVLG